jgi:hypothetical protein
MITSIDKTNATPKDQYARWKDEIKMAEKELDKWQQRGRKIVKRYIDDRDAMQGDARKFNIFTTNVQILSSALYSKIPEVDVDRRFKDQNDDVGRVAANIMQRAITQDLDTPDNIFSQVMAEAIEDRLVPGLGQAWVRIETITEDSAQLDENEEPIPQVVDQKLVVEHVHWQDFLWSPCRTWAERRWVARRVFMDRDSLVKRFGEDIGKKVPLDYTPKTGYREANMPEFDILQRATVYEIWDRQTRTVIWISEGYQEMLDVKDDPLGLDEFEPCPKPLFALTTTGSCVPTPDYYMIQDQYGELDDVNNRISMLVSACKAVGVYDRSASGVERMMLEGVDNTLIPVDNWAMFAEKGGIKGQVDWLPLDTVIQALMRLREAREDIKGQIYELTGISDIARGASKASETLGAQKIKAQFASIRIQQLQDSVVNFATGIFRIKAQMLAKHFTPEMLIKLSMIEFTPDAKNPELVAAAVKLIKNDQEFNWRVSVDSDSMKMADYQAEKQERAEFITSVATYLQSAATMVKAEPLAAPLMIEMLKYAVAASKGSKVLETTLDQMLDDYQKKQAQDEANPKPDPEQQKMEMEMKMKQAEMQMKQQSEMQRAQMEGQKAQMDMQAQQQQMAFDKQRNDMELAFLAQKQQMELVYMQRKQMVTEEKASEVSE